MTGAIIGDIVGSVYEGSLMKSEDFPLFTELSRFTDDSVLTIATADALLQSRNYGKSYLIWGRKYPDAGYGGKFIEWLESMDFPAVDCPPPYYSWGNGAAMRVSPVAYAFNTLHEVEQEAELSARVTHNHPDGIKGARAVGAAIFLAKDNTAKNLIRDYIEAEYDYDLSTDFDKIRKHYRYDISAAGSVPQAITAFLVSENYEDAIRKTISLGGDADTQSCIAGAIAQAYYKDIPQYLISEMKNRIEPEMLNIIQKFSEKFKLDY
jgi:ADP-ribosylglycohydrolase